MVDDLRVAQTEAGAQVTLDLTRSASASAFFVPGAEPRFVIDLPEARWADRIGQGGAGMVARVRHAKRDGGVRVVFDLKASARIAGAERIEHARGMRLVYDLAATAPRTVKAAPPRSPFKPPPMGAAAAKPAVQRADRAPRKVVVVDPGHGGRDPGALSASRRQEKDFNLAAAQVLKESLERRGFTVVLTRDSDVFIPLPERVRIARERQADLFISLHSDADPKGKARGATVYTLSQSGGARAKALAGSQDWGVDLGDAPTAPKVSEILLDLTQRETFDHSREFARSLIAGLGPETPMTTRSARRAGFFVLLAPDVPAVLLEMGYVTHPEDERRLADPAARGRMMEAVAEAVSGYFTKDAAYASVSMLAPSFLAFASP